MATENPYSSPESCPVESQPERRVYRNAEDELLDNSTAVRVFGAIAVVMGGFLGYTGVYTTLADALARKQSFYVHSGAVGSSFIAIVCGMIMLIAGRHTRKILMHRWYNATLVNFIVTLLIVALAIVADMYFERLLTGLGYEFRR